LHIQAINIVSGQEIPGDITIFFAALDSSHRDPQSWSAPPPTAPEIVNLVLSRKEWRLEQDEELQVIESRPQSEQIVLRSVKSIDKVLGIDRAVGYTEVIHSSCPIEALLT